MPQSRGMEADDAALRAYYERGMERERPPTTMAAHSCLVNATPPYDRAGTLLRSVVIYGGPGAGGHATRGTGTARAA
jgi:hypothetical protein